ncbi:MAG: GNAT family N-acetyltransferase, partial [Pseudomonadota bacterium]
MRQFRYANENDLNWLKCHDIHVKEAWIKRCIGHNEYLVSAHENELTGFIRFSNFWGKLPYLDMIFILPEYRNRGIGKSLFLFWEKEMKKNNAKVLITS